MGARSLATVPSAPPPNPSQGVPAAIQAVLRVIRFNQDAVPGGQTEAEIQLEQDRHTARIMKGEKIQETDNNLVRARNTEERFGTLASADNHSFVNQGELGEAASSTTKGWHQDAKEGTQFLEAKRRRQAESLKNIDDMNSEELQKKIWKPRGGTQASQGQGNCSIM